MYNIRFTRDRVKAFAEKYDALLKWNIDHTLITFLLYEDNI